VVIPSTKNNEKRNEIALVLLEVGRCPLVGLHVHYDLRIDLRGDAANKVQFANADSRATGTAESLRCEGRIKIGKQKQ